MSLATTRRRTRCRRRLGAAWAWLFALAAVLSTEFAPNVGAEEPSAEALAHFEAEIRPILARRCYECHSEEAEEIAGELLLDQQEGWLVGGYSGPAVVPGDLEESLLMLAVEYDDPELQMPPKSRLPQREIEALRAWVASGAAAPEGAPTATAEQEDENASATLVAERKAEHWAWRPIASQSPPEVTASGWPFDPVDRFVLARLESAGIAPAGDAGRADWMRRVTFDLRGLPPTREELHAFLSDETPGAQERVVDRLLEETTFGETWASRWLDLVRFAESKGHEQDFDVPHAWRYRDYVIRALNANVPYDQFVAEHVAGDLLPSPRIDPQTRTNQSVQATAFWLLGEATHSPVDIRGEESDRIANSLDVFGKTFLGLTIGCVRCHDHKFDALTTADFYALCGYLQSSNPTEANISDPAANAAAYDRLTELNAEHGDAVLQAEAAALIDQVRRFPEFLARVAAEKRAPASGDAEEHDSPAAFWSRELGAAAADVGHPLHPLGVAFTAAAGERAAATHTALDQWAERIAEHASRTVDEVTVTRKEGELNLVESRRPYDPAVDLIVDFGGSDGRATETEEDDWITAGWRFGHEPAGPGELLFSETGQLPLRRLVPEAAACGDRAGKRFTGLYRTRTFEVAGDVLWYRFRGSAEVFLDVDSHRTVAGPLHGVVKQKLDSPDGEAWFGHQVADYLGHRVHVEFKPTGPFELYEVRFGAETPPLPTAAGEAFAGAVAAGARDSMQEVAAALCDQFVAAIVQVAADSADGEALRLVNWLLERREQLPSPAAELAEKTLAIGESYQTAKAEIEATIPRPRWALALMDGDSEDAHVHIRGSHRRLAAEATPRRFLHALDGEDGMSIERGSGRLQLADRLVADDNPLTARVFVNRVWHHLFGRGLVPTVDDFGAMGEPPSHPELLDYLADDFRTGGWDVKGLIRRLVLSRTYRMSSALEPAAEAADPTNVLLHRAPVRRLTAEQIRDSLLAVSGRLDGKTYGRSVRIHITDFMRHNRSPNWSGPLNGDDRRSIYVEVRRNHLSHFLAAFDRPPPAVTVGRRFVSNSPAQPLILLNDPLVHELAGSWAGDLTDRFDDDAAACEEAYWSAFARAPTETERNRIVGYVRDRSGDDEARESAWREVCLTLFNVKEFIFLH